MFTYNSSTGEGWVWQVVESGDDRSKGPEGSVDMASLGVDVGKEGCHRGGIFESGLDSW